MNKPKNKGIRTTFQVKIPPIPPTEIPKAFIPNKYCSPPKIPCWAAISCKFKLEDKITTDKIDKPKGIS